MPKNEIKPVSDEYYYPHVEMQKKTRLVTETYEYEMPFKYENIRVFRHFMMAREPHGVEMGMVNFNFPDGAEEPQDLVGDSITIEEAHPVVRVAVIGSACTPPGYVQIECEPVEEWRNRYELRTVMPPRFRINNLWGMHLRVDQVASATPEVAPKIKRVDDDPYEEYPEGHFELHKRARGGIWTKAHCREFPLAGMSCAVFEVPPSKRVIIQGGSEIPGWTSDNFPGDHHYSFRTIRTTVLVRREMVE